MDNCLFLRTDSEIVEDEKDPTITIHYQLTKCLIIEGDMGECPFPARICRYKDDHIDPTIEGEGISFSDGSVLENLNNINVIK